VAVTGAEGFIGSHLVEALVARGNRVRAMVQYNAFNSWGWLESLPSEVLASVQIELGDVRDIACVRDLAQGVEVIYHLAALIAIPYSYRSPRSYVETNVVGTLNVLEAARQLRTPRVVHTSTSEVYGTARLVPIDEDHPLQGQSPYAATKIGADKLAESYHLSFGLPVTTLRPFNTYGPRQSARAVIPTIISQVLAGSSTIKLGDLRPTRDFTFVTDTAQAFVAVGEAPAEAVVGRVLNAGTGVETSIGAVVELVGKAIDRTITVVEDTDRLRPADSEVMRLLCDHARLSDTTGWQPRVTLAEGIAATAAWFADPANLKRYRWESYTL
jgi:NDP-hexose 4,6-dehydratase